MDYKIILILIAIYLLITYAMYNCSSKPDTFTVLNNDSNVPDNFDFYKTNPKELIMNQNYIFPTIQEKEIDTPDLVKFVDISNQYALNDYRKVKFALPSLG